MIVYADTSALLKLYVQEEGSNTVRELTASATEVWTHVIAYAELRAALAKARRLERITNSELRALVSDVDTDWASLSIVQVDASLVYRAGALAEQFSLRGFDSVHLAAADRLNSIATPGTLSFTAFADDLCRSAEEIGIALTVGGDS